MQTYLSIQKEQTWLKLKIYKLKPQLSSSIKILDKVKITNNITNTIYHLVIPYFIKSDFLFL